MYASATAIEPQVGLTLERRPSAKSSWPVAETEPHAYRRSSLAASAEEAVAYYTVRQSPMIQIMLGGSPLWISQQAE